MKNNLDEKTIIETIAKACGNDLIIKPNRGCNESPKPSQAGIFARKHSEGNKPLQTQKRKIEQNEHKADDIGFFPT